MTLTESIKLSSPALLQKIDQLRDLNIGKDLPLPQLVAVGDQSSGKSSLLESLTGIPFPRDAGLCTRHATQITSRRDQNSRIDIGIIPGQQASEEHKTTVMGFKKTIRSSKDVHSQFPGILKEASTFMGIRTDMSSKTGRIFSEDILKIETYGPKEEYLTIIDVPGIFRNHTEGITVKDDIELVNKLVRGYIKDRRTIILAVLPSNVDIATQEILALAEEYDPQGERTLGILTKPDLVTESAARMSICSLVSGNRKQLSLGYYIVRNRGGDDKSNTEPEALEKLFAQEPWCALPPERVGIAALKTQLQALLNQITHREFPGLRKEINDKLVDCQRQLDNLGAARPTEREQRSYLSAIARQFEVLNRGALSTHYSHYPFFKTPGTRLTTCLRNLTDVFRDGFQRYGQLRQFKEIESTTPPEEASAETTSTSSITSPHVDFHSYIQEGLEKYGKVKIGEYSELGGIVAEHLEVEEPQDDIMEWLEKLHLRSRGMHLGTFSPEMLSEVFAEQSSRWEPMVRVYMGEVIRLIHHFMINALHNVCTDSDITEGVWSAIMSSVLERYRGGVDQAILLVDIERSQIPFTLNPVYNEDVQIARGKRIKEALRSKAWSTLMTRLPTSPSSSDATQKSDRKLVLNLDDVPYATTAKTNEQYTVEEMHDHMHSYYHLAADRFIDSILRQAVGYHLLEGPRSPLKVFSQAWVIDLDVQELEHIAGEKEASKKRRQMLTKLKKDLQLASTTLRM